MCGGGGGRHTLHSSLSGGGVSLGHGRGSAREHDVSLSPIAILSSCLLHFCLRVTRLCGDCGVCRVLREERRGCVQTSILRQSRIVMWCLVCDVNMHKPQAQPLNTCSTQMPDATCENTDRRCRINDHASLLFRILRLIIRKQVSVLVIVGIP